MKAKRLNKNANVETLGVRYPELLRLRPRRAFPNEFEQIRRRIEVLERRLLMLRGGPRPAARSRPPKTAFARAAHGRTVLGSGNRPAFCRT
jgi:hypothetical protein